MKVSNNLLLYQVHGQLLKPVFLYPWWWHATVYFWLKQCTVCFSKFSVQYSSNIVLNLWGCWRESLSGIIYMQDIWIVTSWGGLFFNLVTEFLVFLHDGPFLDCSCRSGERSMWLLVENQIQEITYWYCATKVHNMLPYFSIEIIQARNIQFMSVVVSKS